MARKQPPKIVAAQRVGDLIGYARVSTEEQILDLQLNALREAGCLNIYQEKVTASGKKKRPQLDLAIKELRPGDKLVVWRLDRLARSMEEFHLRMKQIKEAGGQFRSLTETFDFETPMGGFVVNVLAGVAALERQLTQHRTTAGLDAAKKRGVVLGAATKIDDKMKARIKKMAALTGKQRMILADIAKKEGIALSSIFTVFKGGRKTILKWKPD